EGGLRNTGAARQLGKVKQPATANGQQADQLRQLGQAFDIGQILDIALQDGGQITVEPGTQAALAGALRGFRVTTSNQAGNKICPIKGVTLGKVTGEQAVNDTAATPVQLALRPR